MTEKNILLVDQDAHTLEVIREEFAAEGFIVESATNGKRAVQMVAHKRPDLILLEIKLRQMDGWEVCALLKKNEGTKKIPLIFFSADSSMQNKLQAFQLGADGFISKPVANKNLIEQVKKILKQGVA